MTTTLLTLSLEAEGRDAAARSQLYRRLSEAFVFPEESFTEALTSGQWGVEMAVLSEELPFELRIAAPPHAEARELADAYVTVFEVGTGKPFCPLYEGSHRSGRMKLMEDLVRFYEYFGLKTIPGDHPDHLCAELDFMHYLAFKEAAVQSHGQDSGDLARAQFDFLDRHICRWTPRLHRRLAGGERVPPFYVFLADLANQFCTLDRAWLKVGGENPHRKVRSQPDSVSNGYSR